jgi:hypothetical protein
MRKVFDQRLSRILLSNGLEIGNIGEGKNLSTIH